MLWLPTMPANMHRPLRIVRRTALVAGAALAFAWLALTIAVGRLGPLPMARAEALSPIVLDRNGVLLRAYTATDDHWRLPLEPSAVDPLYLKMLLAFEDRRFHVHRGVDPIATVRAVAQFLRHGRIVSGSSTLTMQVARLLDGVHERDAAGKLRQMLRAIQIERNFDKTAILRLYLELAPFGGNLEGVRAASLAYFGIEPRRLSPAQAALLVALPQSPEQRKPDRFPAAARLARDRVLQRAFAAGLLRADEVLAARREPIPAVRRDFPKLAPHLADADRAAAPAEHVHHLTLDARLQSALERATHDHAVALGQGLSAAVVAVDNATGQILAEVGSAGLFDWSRAGAVDMANAVRSPGSTLKPLIYGLAFEGGLAHPDTLIDDRPIRFGAYNPKNFDRDWHGTVTVREALAQSLNIPAVEVLDAVGPQKFFTRMRQARLDPQLPLDAEPSLAMALGGVGLRLVDLAQLYVGLARGGDAIVLRHRLDEASAGPAVHVPLLTPVAAYYIGDILRHAPPPVNAPPGQIAFKTGTSYGNRDAWAVGYDGRNTVAVWVGRPDATAVPDLAGRASAAPLLFDAFQKIAAVRTPLPQPPAGVIKATGADLPPPLRRFNAAPASPLSASPFRTAPLRIVSPPDRAEIDVEASDGVVVRADGGALPLTWLIDGAVVSDPDRRRELAVPPAARGFVRVSVIDANGLADRITVRLK